MSFNLKIFYTIILGASFHCIQLISSPVCQSCPPAWLPLFIQKFWNNLEWKSTCASLENNEQYKLLKTKLGSNIEKLVLPTSIANQLAQEDKIYLQSNDYLNNEAVIDELAIQIKFNNLLIEENFKYFEPAHDFYLSEADGKLMFIRTRTKNLSNFVPNYKNRGLLYTEAGKELIRFIEKTGFAYTEKISEDVETHHLQNWWPLSPDNFKHTNKLEALADFARAMDPEYGSYGNDRRSILNKESMDKLKERIFELTKKCIDTHERYNMECYTKPLSEIELPE